MTTAERIIVGVASLIALIGWLRWAGEAHSHREKKNHHRTGPPKYQRPSNGRSKDDTTSKIDDFPSARPSEVGGA
jgi:hypothetical protein